MTLATRCAACGTAFRVVEDQLKVSDGWVRCGSCNGVFNASEHLFSLPEAPQATGDAAAVEASLDDAVDESAVLGEGAVDFAAPVEAGAAPLVEAKGEPESESKPQFALASEAEPESEPRTEPEPEPEPEPENMAQATDSELQSSTSDEPQNLEAASPPSDAEARIAEPLQNTQALHADVSEEPLASEPHAVASAPAPSNRTPPVQDSIDTDFASTVAVSGSSEFPPSASGFGAGQPHSAFRDSDAPPDGRIDAHLFKKSRRSPTKSLSERDRPDFSDARFDSDLMAYEEDGTAAGTNVSDSPATHTENMEPVAAPAFLRQAERRARWQRPKVRIALAVGAARSRSRRPRTIERVPDASPATAPPRHRESDG